LRVERALVLCQRPPRFEILEQGRRPEWLSFRRHQRHRPLRHRPRFYHRMLGEWARRDAAAVKQWVASNGVPPSVAERFLR
jgi:hypothetical protein